MDGDEVAQAYIRYPDGRRLPLCELRAFERLSIAAGGAAEMRVAIPLASLAKWDIQTNGLAVPAGEYVIFAGGHSADAQVEAKFNIVP